MRRIKITLLLILISIFSFAQTNNSEKIILSNDTTLNLNLSVDPISITFKNAPIDDNEALVALLGVETLQTKYLNQKLTDIDNSIDSLPYKEVQIKRQLVNELYTDVEKVVNKESKIIFISLIFLLVFFIPFSIIYSSDKKSYWNKRARRMVMTICISGIFFSGIVLPLLLTVIFNPDYFLVRHIETIFKIF